MIGTWMNWGCDGVIYYDYLIPVGETAEPFVTAKSNENMKIV
jgi:hypothetical protein